MHTTIFLLNHAIFTTRSFAMLTESRLDSSSRRLNKLADQGVIKKVTRGIWAQTAHPKFTPFGAVSYLLDNEQGYISFLSAMHSHGLISQIPGSIQIATTGHTRVLTSPIGRYEFFRIRPQMMMDGIDITETDPPYAIARAEKALLDTLYIASRKGRRFTRLPEIGLDRINGSSLTALLKSQTMAPPMLQAVKNRLCELSR